MPRNYNKITELESQIQRLKLENQQLRFLLKTIARIIEEEQSQPIEQANHAQKN